MVSSGHIVVLVLSVVGCWSKTDFVLRDCASSPSTELLTMPTARVSPYPVGIPGDIAVTGNLRVNRPVTGSLKIDLQVERYVGFFWLTVPCISEVGSCTYDDGCKILSDNFNATGCPPQLKAGNVPCMCPIPAGTYSLADSHFTIPELPAILSWLAEGDYRVTVKLLDGASGQQVACQHLEGTIADPDACSGFLCSVFG